MKQHAISLHTLKKMRCIQLQEDAGGRLSDPMMYEMGHLEQPRPQTLYENEVS